MISENKGKMFKVLVLFSLIFSFIGASIPAFASTTKTEDYFSNIDRLFKESDMDVTYNQLSLNEINEDFSMLDDTSKGSALLQDIKSQGYTESQVENPYNIRLVSNDDNSLVTDSVYKFYENKNGDRIMIQLIIDQTNSEINHAVAQKIVNGSNKAETIFEESSKTLYSVQSRKSFNFNGKSFACSMTGLLTCSSYCVVWGLVNVAAGLTCEAACGTAMAAVCATV